MQKDGMDMVSVKLVVVGGAPEGDEFQLELPSVLGRSRDATLPLPHPLVSRQHCELFERDGQLFVRDLGSTNGTFVGSERVTESILEEGGLLTIGTVTFRAFFTQKHAFTSPSHDDIASSAGQGQLASKLDTTINRVDTGVIGGSSKKSKRRTQKAR